MTALVAAALAGAPAAAHDEKPQHGGVVQSVKDIGYELAAHAQGLMVYVQDHGNPVPTAGISGTLVLVEGARRSEVPLRPAGENRLLAAGAQRGAGQRVSAVLAMPSGRQVVVQFPSPK